MKRPHLDRVAQLLVEDIPALATNFKTILWWSCLPSGAFAFVFCWPAWMLSGSPRAMLRAVLLGIACGVAVTALVKRRWWVEHWPRHGARSERRDDPPEL